MSELKAYRVKGVTIGDTHDVYLKSEADKVIAELKEILNNSRNARKYWRKEYLIEYKESIHHKYKRCLYMANKCVDLCHKAKDLYRWAEDENLEHHYNRKIELFARLHNSWLKLAEKFKEAK